MKANLISHTFSFFVFWKSLLYFLFSEKDRKKNLTSEWALLDKFAPQKHKNQNQDLNAFLDKSAEKSGKLQKKNKRTVKNREFWFSPLEVRFLFVDR